VSALLDAINRKIAELEAAEGKHGSHWVPVVQQDFSDLEAARRLAFLFDKFDRATRGELPVGGSTIKHEPRTIGTWLLLNTMQHVASIVASDPSMSQYFATGFGEMVSALQSDIAAEPQS
jgi:hypothetical protein